MSNHGNDALHCIGARNLLDGGGGLSVCGTAYGSLIALRRQAALVFQLL